MDELGARFVQVQDVWLWKALYFPMAYFHSLLFYSRRIASGSSCWLMVSWSKQGRLMLSMGKRVLIVMPARLLLS